MMLIINRLNSHVQTESASLTHDVKEGFIEDKTFVFHTTPPVISQMGSTL